MPNLKLYVDQNSRAAAAAGLTAVLPDLRAALCARLSVPVSACQLAIITVEGMEDQRAINAELMILPAETRPHALRLQLAHELRDLIQAATGIEPAVRIALLDRDTYLGLK